MRPLTRSAREERRLHFAVAQQQQSRTVAQWASAYQVSISAISQWKATLKVSGIDGLKARTPSGRPRRLTPDQEQCVQQWLQGVDSPLQAPWSLRDVRELIGEHFGVWYHLHHVRKLLIRWGWHCHVQ
ncbi:helix-turn-helix domain-containing protein [Deinococcus cellulosilyticus]|uniref:helix-turn-helix domain-containing protein n=1 Tax=Deinococcus cellulosilyticus TaxID=401558 RepID=UPI0011BED4CB